MAFDEELASRVKKIVARKKGVSEKRMFGGVAFLVGGKMFCGVVKGDLMARVGAEDNDKFLREKGARPMDFTGKPMRGFIFVSKRGTERDASLRMWVDASFNHAKSLPKK